MNGEIDQFDVIILGAGAAGLSAAMWCSELGLRSIVLEEKSEIGGQLHWIHTPILNYPGVETDSGGDFLECLQKQLKRRKFEIHGDAQITNVNFSDKVVSLDKGVDFQAEALILATGVRRRSLGIEGENDFDGKGVLETGQTDRQLLAGKKLMIVGGGDAAFENAAVLSSYAEHVYLLHRRSAFTARKSFLEKVIGNPKVETITDASLKRLIGRDRLEFVEYIDGKTGEMRSLSVDTLLIRIGVTPNSELFRGSLDLDDRGYVRVNSACETSVTRVFAIGDVANPVSPTIATAAGTAAIAAKSIRSLLKRD